VEVPVERIVTRWVPAPVERVVLQAVPVERIVERRVVKVVEKPVERIVERMVPAPRPIRVDTAPLARAVAGAARAWERTVPVLAAAARRLAPAAGPARPPRPRPAPPVTLEEEAGGVLVLRTRGPLDRVVPHLLNLAESGDGRIRAAARARLAGIREELLRNGARGAPPPSLDRWRDWWRANRHALPALGN
jgi:hypothetical protein